MKIHCRGLNVFLLLALGLSIAFMCGCRTDKPKKQVTTLCFYLETSPYFPSNSVQTVPIGRGDHPIMVTVEKLPFLCEGEIKTAKVIDAIGGFSLRLECERKGAMLLEQYTGGNIGKRVALFSRFLTMPEKKLNAGRWLGAPVIRKRIDDGVFIFTPDATREEAEQIAHGLNAIGSQLEKDSKYW